MHLLKSLNSISKALKFSKMQGLVPFVLLLILSFVLAIRANPSSFCVAVNSQIGNFHSKRNFVKVSFLLIDLDFF